MFGVKFAPFIASLKWIWSHKLVIFAAITGILTLIFGSILFLGFGFSNIPLSFWVFFVFSMVSIPVGLTIGVIIVVALYNPDGIPLIELDPVTGSVGAHLLSEEVFGELVVVDSKGREIDVTRLHKVKTLLGVGYEVKRYNPNTNVCQISFSGEQSAVELRRYRQTVEALDDQYDDVVDQLVEIRARHHHSKREAIKDTTMEIFLILEGIETPAGENFVTDIVERTSEESGINDMATLEDVVQPIDQPDNTTLDMDQLRGEAV